MIKLVIVGCHILTRAPVEKSREISGMKTQDIGAAVKVTSPMNRLSLTPPSTLGNRVRFAVVTNPIWPKVSSLDPLLAAWKADVRNVAGVWVTRTATDEQENNADRKNAPPKRILLHLTSQISHGKVSWQIHWMHFDAGLLASSSG